MKAKYKNVKYEIVRVRWIEGKVVKEITVYNVYIAGCLGSGGKLLLKNEDGKIIFQVEWDSIEILEKRNF